MEGFLSGLGIIGVILIIAALLLPVIALIDIYKRRKQNTGKTLIWVLIILFVPYLGSIVYFLMGRK